MKGFKDFIMRGNLVELAVAFIMATAFAAVVTAFTTIILDLVGKAGGVDAFSDYTPGGVHVGAFITATITFVIIAAVVYFLVVLPYQKVRERMARGEDDTVAPTEDVALLTEIRDLLAARERGDSGSTS